MVLVYILAILFTLVAAALVLIVLVQRPQGGGLSGAFGGAGGGSDTVFGGRTGDALTLATVVAFVLFLGLAIGLNLIEVKPEGATTGADASQAVDTSTLEGSAPITSGAPTPINTGATPQDGGSEPIIRRVDPSEIPTGVLEQAGQGGTAPQQPPAEQPGNTEPGTGGAQPE